MEEAAARREGAHTALGSGTFEAAVVPDENLGGPSSEPHGQDWGNHWELALAHRKPEADQEDTSASGD